MTRHWIPAEDARLIHMRDVDHASIQNISRELKRTRDACKCRYTLLHKRTEPDPIRARIDLIADRDARYRAGMRQSAAAALMGDPLPGRSALDQRRQSEAR